MMGLFAKKASIGDKVILTVIDRNLLKGGTKDFGEDFILLKQKKNCRLNYKMMGA